MKFAHLLIVTTLDASLGMFFAGVARVLGLGEWSFAALAIPAMTATIFLAWPIARLFRVPRLMIFAGPCPGCGRRPPGWWGHQIDRHLLQLACGECGQRVDLWLTRCPSGGDLASVPAFVLRRPRFL